MRETWLNLEAASTEDHLTWAGCPHTIQACGERMGIR